MQYIVNSQKGWCILLNEYTKKIRNLKTHLSTLRVNFSIHSSYQGSFVSHF